jgi:Nif-specific regulatory protein
LQVKLLRFLQEREYQAVGSDRSRKADLRIVCATNRDLEAAVRNETVRQDMYYRINVFPLVLPSLRERKDDILLLANHFCAKHGPAMGKEVRRISTPAITMLLAYHWPGNVRELENCIEHAVLLSDEGVIQSHHLPPTLQTPTANGPTVGGLAERVAALERDLIVDALKRNDGNASASARELAVTPRILRYKIKNLELDLSSVFA